MCHWRCRMPAWVGRMRWCFISQSTIVGRLPLYFFRCILLIDMAKKTSWMKKTGVTKENQFFQFFSIFFIFLQNFLFKRPMRPTSNREHSSGQRVQRALQSDHFCSYNIFLNIYFGKNLWRRKKYFWFLELRLEKMKKKFAFSKTSRSGKSSLSSRDVFGFLIFTFPMQNHNSK